MGVIHRADDRVAKREVAYKRLRVVDESSRVRVNALFQREYDTLARLAHPNIVEVYDWSGRPGPYYVMELLRGKDLTEGAPMPLRETCRVLRDIASALALVHARKLIHRDVSPSNIRLTNDGRTRCWKSSRPISARRAHAIKRAERLRRFGAPTLGQRSRSQLRRHVVCAPPCSRR